MMASKNVLGIWWSKQLTADLKISSREVHVEYCYSYEKVVHLSIAEMVLNHLIIVSVYYSYYDMIPRKDCLWRKS